MSGWYFGIGTNGKAIMRAVSSSTGSADADKIPRLDANGKIDISMLPSSVTEGVEVRNSANNVLGNATVLREGTNIGFSLSGGTLTINSLLGDAMFIFDPSPENKIYNAFPTWTPSY